MTARLAWIVKIAPEFGVRESFNELPLLLAGIGVGYLAAWMQWGWAG